MRNAETFLPENLKRKCHLGEIGLDGMGGNK
jgi:hypothetical protein